MLVLTRKPNERICFPTLGIKLSVVKIEGGRVRIGIDAPREIPICREEIPPRHHADAGAEHPRAEQSPFAKETMHAIRNRLNVALLKLHMLQRKADHVVGDELYEAIDDVAAELAGIEGELARGDSTAQPDSQEDAAGPRALVVDDNEQECQLMADFLELHGYQVATANDGWEALERLSGREKPDLILLDMQMPRLNGAATVRRIRQDRSLDGVRIFALSGLSSQEAGVPVGQDGVDEWLQKPIRPSEIVRRLEARVGAAQG